LFIFIGFFFKTDVFIGEFMVFILKKRQNQVVQLIQNWDPLLEEEIVGPGNHSIVVDKVVSHTEDELFFKTLADINIFIYLLIIHFSVKLNNYYPSPIVLVL